MPRTVSYSGGKHPSLNLKPEVEVGGATCSAVPFEAPKSRVPCVALEHDPCVIGYCILLAAAYCGHDWMNDRENYPMAGG